MMWLFRLTLAAAGLLAVLPFAAPLFAPPDGGGVLRLFADDGAVRRTSWACAAGLACTAFVFFRPPPPAAEPRAEEPPCSTG